MINSAKCGLLKRFCSKVRDKFKLAKEMFIKKDEQKCRVLYGVTSKGSGVALHLSRNYITTMLEPLPCMYSSDGGWGVGSV